MILASIQEGNEADPEIDAEVLMGQFMGNEGLPVAVMNLGEYYYNRYFAHSKEGNTAAAQAAMRKAIAAWEKLATTLPDNPHTGEAWYMSARAYESLGEYGDALMCCQSVIDNWPDYRHADYAHYLLARCLEKLAQSGVISKAEAAEQIHDVCARLSANHPNSRAVGLASVLLRRWEPARAR